MTTLRYCIVLLLFNVAFAGQVHAHAEVINISPQNGTVTPEAPDEFVVQFSEPVSVIRVQLLNSQRQTLELTRPDIVNNELSFAPVDILPEGQYLMSFRVLSLDAHPVSGSVGFAVGELPAPLPEFTQSDITVLSLSRFNRSVQLLAILGCVGLVLFPLLFKSATEIESFRHRLLNFFIIAAILTSLTGLGLWGILLEGVTISSFFEPAIWSLASRTSLWTSFILVITGCMGILISNFLDPDLPPGKFSAWLGALLMILSLGASGHAAVAATLVTPVFVIHALMGAIWFAALCLLLRTVSTVSSDKLKQALELFSKRIMPLISLLLICALLLSWEQLNSIEALVSSKYGNWLVLKLGLVLLVLLFAAINRWRLTPALLTDNKANQILRRSIGAEIILLLAVLGVTSILASTAPPSGIQGTTKTLTVTSGLEITLELKITPGSVGSNDVTLKFSRNEVNFLPIEVSLYWQQFEMAIEPVSRDAIVDENGLFHIEEMTLLVSGTWQLRVEALIDDFTRERFEMVIELE
jgi:copper transport protein